MSWWASMFAPDIVRKHSALGLILSRREGVEATQWHIRLQCRENSATAQSALLDPTREERAEARVPLEAYLGLWEEIIESGFIALAMSGAFKAGDGTDLYFEAGVGPDGLGWVFSTRRERVQEEPALGALYDVLVGFAKAHAPLIDTYPEEFSRLM